MTDKSEDLSWHDFICMDKEPAVLEAVSWGSGIVKGHRYQCWGIKKNKYKIFNSMDRSVLAAKGYFKVIDTGDVKGINKGDEK